MEKITIQQDIKVFGVQVKTFPMGIAEAFDGLVEQLSKDNNRLYYGISECTNNGIVYIAAALEMYEGEAEQYGYEKFIVEKGEYLAITVMDWMPKTHLIKDVFETLFKDDSSDRTKPAIEMYKNDNEMVCMVKVKQEKVVASNT